jgi:hypothetical protein
LGISIMQAEGRLRGMEKHTVTNICRLGAVLVAVALTAGGARANLLQNSSFEIPGTNATTAANWNIFGNAAVSGTNNTVVTIHTGLASLSAGITVTNVLAGSGAFQDVPAASGVNNNWRLTGYLLTWINAKITGPDSYGVAQLVFLDSSSNVLQIVESQHYGTDANLPVNTWVPFEVDATAPAGTVTVRCYFMYISDSLDGGNAFFDDVGLYNPTSSSTASVATQPAVQVSWPTSSRTNGIDYQVQSTKSLVFSNAPVVSVLTNGGFETNAAPWTAFNGGGRSTVFARTGAGSMRLSGGSNAVPGCFQIVGPASPGQVWDLQGYGYSSSTPGQGITNAGTRALIKLACLIVVVLSLMLSTAIPTRLALPTPHPIKALPQRRK